MWIVEKAKKLVKKVTGPKKAISKKKTVKIPTTKVKKAGPKKKKVAVDLGNIRDEFFETLSTYTHRAWNTYSMSDVIEALGKVSTLVKKDVESFKELCGIIWYKGIITLHQVKPLFETVLKAKVSKKK